ncbi:MAG: nuclear transport factor 2 family protein [Actinomycetota bacterium]
MSRENSGIALQLIEASNRRDVDAFLALVSPDVEWEDPVFWSEVSQTYRGRAEVRAWFNRVVEPWESLHFEVEEITETPDDRVFLETLLTTRGKGSGAETQIRLWYVVWIANGKITRRQVFRGRDEALEAAGLRDG